MATDSGLINSGDGWVKIGDGDADFIVSLERAGYDIIVAFSDSEPTDDNGHRVTFGEPFTSTNLTGDLWARTDSPDDIRYIVTDGESFNIASGIHNAPSKTTPVDADELGIWNSVTGLLNKVTFANLATWVKSAVYAYVGTWALRPAATGYTAGTRILITDVGMAPCEFITDAEIWRPLNGEVLLSRLTLPMVKAPTFTGTTNGAITLGTAVPTEFSRCFMYFPANSLVASHSAGWYYAEMSSTSAAIVYNNTYTPSNGTFPEAPTSKTAFSGAVPGGAGVTATVTAFQFELKAGLMGKSGSLSSYLCCSHNNSATAKTANIILDGNTFNYVVSVAGSQLVNGIGYISNVNSEAVQRTKDLMTVGTTGNVPLNFSVNTANSVTVSLTLRSGSAATDVVAIETFSMRLIK